MRTDISRAHRDSHPEQSTCESKSCMKVPYDPPKLVCLGDLRDFTMGITGGAGESGPGDNIYRALAPKRLGAMIDPNTGRPFGHP
jgi:hypothetical protein